MSKLTLWMDQTFYSGFQRNWDDKLFRKLILGYINPGSIVLDLGAGAGIVEHMNFHGIAQKVCGIDLDPRVVDNPMLDEGCVANGSEIPFSDNKFDLVFSDNVLEHLDKPLDVFREVERVLKPGGFFLFKTPNKTHYMPAIARLTPHVFHQFVNRLRGRSEVDTFPTRYRANTKSDVAKHASDAGLQLVNVDRIEGRPEYLRMTWLTYLIGVAYERIVNSTGFLEPFRILLVGVLRKPD